MVRFTTQEVANGFVVTFEPRPGPDHTYVFESLADLKARLVPVVEARIVASAKTEIRSARA